MNNSLYQQNSVHSKLGRPCSMSKLNDSPRKKQEKKSIENQENYKFYSIYSTETSIAWYKQKQLYFYKKRQTSARFKKILTNINSDVDERLE